MITWLNVPFRDNQKAKRLGAKWSIAHKRWFVENVENIQEFLDWIPDALKAPSSGQTKSAAKCKGDLLREAAAAARKKKRGAK